MAMLAGRKGAALMQNVDMFILFYNFAYYTEQTGEWNFCSSTVCVGH